MRKKTRDKIFMETLKHLDTDPRGFGAYSCNGLSLALGAHFTETRYEHPKGKVFVTKYRAMFGFGRQTTPDPFLQAVLAEFEPTEFRWLMLGFAMAAWDDMGDFNDDDELRRLNMGSR